MALGRYGRAFLASLKENRPEAYRSMSVSGTLERHAQEVDRRATEQFESLLAQFQKQEPLPKGFVERSQALDGMRQRAEELVMQEVLVPDEETERAMVDGYRDEPEAQSPE